MNKLKRVPFPEQKPYNNYKEKSENAAAEETIPQGILPTKDFTQEQQDISPESVYQWYALAISRRDRDPIEEDRFIKHFFEGGSFDATYLYGDKEKGFILGFFKHGIFIPTHFAPKTLRGGYELFKELGESKTIPVAGAITEDLVETLTKLPGWKTLKLNLLAYFNSDLVEKTVIYNSCPGIKKKMFKLVKDFIIETKQIQEENADNKEIEEFENIEEL